MKKKNIQAVLSSFFMVFVLCLPFFVFAQSVTGSTSILSRMKNVGVSGGFADATETSLASNLGLIVNVILSLLGVMFVILIIFAGVKWMTAGGNEKQIEEAQKKISNTVIGLLIVIAAYSIWTLIDRYFIKGGA